MEQKEDFGFTYITEEEILAKRPEPTFLEKAARRGKRYLLRGAESIAGIPGDIAQLATGAAQALPGAIAEEDLNIAQRLGRQAVGAIPGSAQLREKSAEMFPELEPETAFESVEDEFIGDAAALLLPVKGKVPFSRALGMSALGNMSKQAIKSIGGGDTSQEVGKFGSMIFGGLFGKGRGVNKFINETYRKADKFVPKGANFEYPVKKLNKVEKLLSKGTMNEAKSEAMSILKDIEAKSPAGLMTVENAVQFDKDINRAIGRAGKDASKAGNLKQLKSAHSEALSEYAKENPTWGKHYQDAKMAYKGIAQSENIKKFVRKNLDLKNIAYAGALLGMEEFGFPGHAIPKLGAIGAVGASYFSREMAKRLATNPALRGYYQNVLKASISDNAPMLSRNIKGLEKAAKKEFEENPLSVEIISFLNEDIEE